MSDLGLSDYAEKKCFNLGKIPYASLVSGSASSKSKKKKGKGKAKSVPSRTYDEGVMFSTYAALVGKQKNSGMSRLDQLLEWCGEDFDGLIMLDECHKAKTVDLDEHGNAKYEKGKMKCSQTAAKVVELQNSLPRARVVYCSATSVSEPKNLGFMCRLGLWGPGTEHPLGFSQFLQGLERLGTGAMELHAMHLKSIGAICARTLSYEDCEFALVDNDSDEKARAVYNSAAELWGDLLSALADKCAQLKGKGKTDKRILDILERGDPLPDDLLFHKNLHCDSDSEDDYDSEDEGEGINEQRFLRRKYRNRAAKTLRGLFWSAHQVSYYFFLYHAYFFKRY